MKKKLLITSKILLLGFILFTFHGFFTYTMGGKIADESKYPNIVPPKSQFGVWGYKLGEFIDPIDIAIDENNEIYVTDRDNHRIQIFTPEGKVLRAWGKQGNEPGKLNMPSGIAIYENEVFISDKGNNRIQVFDKLGNYLRKWGKYGYNPTNFIGPSGIAAANEKIYVSDTGNNRIQVFDVKGNLLLIVSGYGNVEGKLNQPIGLTVDEKGQIYVADSQNNRIQKFSSNGTFMKAWGSLGSLSGDLATPTDVSYGAGLLYVADLVNHRIQVFDTNGNFAFQFGRHPPNRHEGNGRIHYPITVAVNKSGSLIVECEPFENRCQSFDKKSLLSVKNVDDSAWWDKGPTRFHYGKKVALKGNILTISEPETHTVLVFDFSSPKDPKLITAIGGFGNKLGSFKMPSGSAIDLKRNRIYVSDSFNHRVQVFEIIQNKSVKVITSFGKFGNGKEDFNEPGGMAIDAVGNLYVLDVMNSRIKVYDPNLKFLREWGKNGTGKGEFIAPMEVAIDPTNNIVYIVDSFNYRVQAFNKQGDYLFEWGTPRKSNMPKSRGGGEFVWPFGITVDNDGAVYVTDTGGQMVQKFDRNGKFILEWGRIGTGPGEFYKPKGIAFDLDSKKNVVVVVDFGNHRVQVFTPNGKFVSMFGIGTVFIEPEERAKDVNKALKNDK